MLTYEQMPEDNEELAKIEIEFEHVPLDMVYKPEEIEPHMLEYLEIEGFVLDNKLKFLRTAKVEDCIYWIWEFTSDSEKTYATAQRDKDGEITIGFETDYYGLTPEQYILGDYHACF